MQLSPPIFSGEYFYELAVAHCIEGTLQIKKEIGGFNYQVRIFYSFRFVISRKLCVFTLKSNVCT